VGRVVWSTELLALLHAPATPANYQFLNQWLLREHAAGDLYGQQYGNNPFFTTAGAGGTVGPVKAGTYPRVPASVSPGANRAGVAMYPSLDIGVLLNAFHIGTEYPAITAALKSGNPGSFANNPTFEHELSAWSGGGYSGFQSIAAPSGPVGQTVDSGTVSTYLQQVLHGQLKTPTFTPAPGSTGAGVAGAIGSTGAGVAGAIGGAVSSAEAVAKFLGELSSTSFLLRAGQVLAGGVLVFAGLFLLAKQVGLADNVPAIIPAVP
jgi:hypothetical protein